jgi:Flp pilus assembly protein TadD
MAGTGGTRKQFLKSPLCLAQIEGMAEKNAMAIPREVRLLYTKGEEAVTRQNYDYAIDLLNQALVKEPAFVDCRRTLRKAQQRKADTTKTSFFKKVFTSTTSSPLIAKAQIALRTNPADALATAEQILNSDPMNSGAHKVIVEAAKTLELRQTSLMSLEVLFLNNPRDRDVAIDYANALAEDGRVAQGEKVLADLAKQLPYDPELLQALKNITARRTMSEGGYDALADGQGSYRDILKNEEEAKALEQENRVQKSEDNTERLIREYEGRLKSEPGNLKPVRQLAELYTLRKRFDDALKMYERLKASESGNDPTLDKAMADLQAKRLDYAAEQLDKTAPDYEEQVAKLSADKLALQLAECQKRVEKFPTDLAMRFELGALYFQAGKIGEAIQEFQKAQNNPHKRIAALGFLAKCYAARKMFDLAAKRLTEAIKEKQLFDDEKKDLTYTLGSVLETMGKREEAIEQFKLIFDVDIGYRDVEKKVNDYYAGQ